MNLHTLTSGTKFTAAIRIEDKTHTHTHPANHHHQQTAKFTINSRLNVNTKIIYRLPKNTKKGCIYNPHKI